MSDETIKLTADVVALAEYDGVTWILLIQRDDEPYTGCWALPGGHVDSGEDATDAARRELAEETNVTVSHSDLTPMGAYHAVGRDPRGRYVTIAYLTEFAGHLPQATAADDARQAEWIPIDRVFSRLLDPLPLAFDHGQIIQEALLGDYPKPPTTNGTNADSPVVNVNHGGSVGIQAGHIHDRRINL